MNESKFSQPVSYSGIIDKEQKQAEVTEFVENMSADGEVVDLSVETGTVEVDEGGSVENLEAGNNAEQVEDGLPQEQLQVLVDAGVANEAQIAQLEEMKSVDSSQENPETTTAEVAQGDGGDDNGVETEENKEVTPEQLEQAEKELKSQLNEFNGNLDAITKAIEDNDGVIELSWKERLLAGVNSVQRKASDGVLLTSAKFMASATAIGGGIAAKTLEISSNPELLNSVSNFVLNSESYAGQAGNAAIVGGVLYALGKGFKILKNKLRGASQRRDILSGDEERMKKAGQDILTHDVKVEGHDPEYYPVDGDLARLTSENNSIVAKHPDKEGEFTSFTKEEAEKNVQIAEQKEKDEKREELKSEMEDLFETYKSVSEKIDNLKNVQDDIDWQSVRVQQDRRSEIFGKMVDLKTAEYELELGLSDEFNNYLDRAQSKSF